VDADHLLPDLARLLVALVLGVEVAEVEQGGGLARVQLDGALVFRERLEVQFLLVQRDGQIGMIAGVVRVQRDGLAEGRDRGIELARRVEPPALLMERFGFRRRRARRGRRWGPDRRRSLPDAFDRQVPGLRLGFRRSAGSVAAVRAEGPFPPERTAALGAERA